MANAKQKPTNVSPQENAVDRSKAKIENFRRLASKRMSGTLAKLAGIKALANRSSYTYDDIQVTKILNALKQSVNEIEVAFKTPQAASVKASFEL